MKEYFSVKLYSYVIFFRFSINFIKALMRMTVMEVVVQQVVAVGAILMNHSAIMIVMM